MAPKKFELFGQKEKEVNNEAVAHVKHTEAFSDFHEQLAHNLHCKFAYKLAMIRGCFGDDFGLLNASLEYGSMHLAVTVEPTGEPTGELTA